MNTYNTIKLSYMQMLIKGQLMEKWQKHIFWVMQDYVFENMQNRFNLQNLAYDKQKFNHYFIYDLLEAKKQYHLKLKHQNSTTVANLLTAFTNQKTPDMVDFINHLETKIKNQVLIFKLYCS